MQGGRSLDVRSSPWGCPHAEERPGGDELSQVPQGPGWWQASDGRWYPPQAAPAGAPVPPAGPTYGYPPPGWVAPPRPAGPPPGWVAPTTSGLAIASLVLAIVWLGGLGSILAVVFGIIALSQIKGSVGRKKGEGVAIAGLVIGGLGVLSTIGIVVAAVAFAPVVERAFTATNLQVGQTGTYSSGLNNDVVRLTVESVVSPYTSTVPFVSPPAGDELAVATVRECAGPDGDSSGLSGFGWSLGFPGGASVGPSADAKNPGIDSYADLAPDECVVGSITFQVAVGTSPSYLQYDGAILDPYRWQLGATSQS